MLETEDRPTGGGPMTPRRSPGTWLLVAAAIAIVAIVGGLLVAAAGDDDDTKVPATTPTTLAKQAVKVTDYGEEHPTLAPGLYYVDPDLDDSTPLRVTYEVTEEGWNAWIGAAGRSASTQGGSAQFSITTVPNLVIDGCSSHDPLAPPVGETVDDLATAFTELKPFQVAAAPTDVTIFGYSGKHLALKVPDLAVSELQANGRREFVDCVDGELHSWVSPLLGGSYWGYDGVPNSTEEFWVLDVEGTRLVLEKLTAPNASAETIAERDAMFDSIQIEP